MRVIRPAALYAGGRRRRLLLAIAMVAAGLLAAQLALLSPLPALSGAMAGASAIGLGVGAAWGWRAARPTRGRRLVERLVAILGSTLDDSYTLVVAPSLPVRDAERLDGLLIGPGGVRAITIRDWEGRYRVRGRVWEFDARGRRGWITCRTNPSFDAIAVSNAVGRWAATSDLGELPIRPVIAFPDAAARLVLEEPEEEIVTADNAPWWANAFGRVRRLDPADAARLLEAVLDAGERSLRAGHGHGATGRA